MIVSPPAVSAFPEGPVDLEFDHVWFAYRAEDWGAARRKFPRRAGRDGGHRGTYGCRQNNFNQSAAAVFTTCSRGRFASAESTFVSSTLSICAVTSEWSYRTPTYSRVPVSSNVRLGTEQISDEQVRNASEQVNLLEFIEELPQGFDTPVRGARQRIFHRAEAAYQFCARFGARSAHPDFGRSHLQRGYRDRAACTRSFDQAGTRPHFAGDCASPFHHSTRGPHCGDA